MPKINQEEYEVLKEIKRNGFEEIRRNSTGDIGVRVIGEKITGHQYQTEHNDKFKFLEATGNYWSIAELIKEYEKDYKGSWEHAIEFSREVFDESEETEVKKDIEWLKEEISIERKLLSESLVGVKETTVERIFNDGKEHGLIFASNRINQLDEPEVLSQEWISEHMYYVHDREASMVYVNDLQNLLVPKQEKVKVDKEDAENIKDYKEEGWRLSHLINDTGADANHEELLAQAWLAYPNIEVEEEQKYYVLNKELQPMLCKSAGTDKKIMESTTQLTINEKGLYKEQYALTEQEIKDYDPRYWAFAKPVEELEE